MKYRFVNISGEQIKAGFDAYMEWAEQGEPDAIANLVCEVHLAMNQACAQRTVHPGDQSTRQSEQQCR